jgi:ATP-dependent exoDNAse (exonuclease V) beta subunit
MEGHGSGIIDAVFKHGGDWTLVEFKTDYIASEAKFEVLLDEGDYVAQVQRYAEAVAQLLGERPICYLCFLNDRGKTRSYRVH